MPTKQLFLALIFLTIPCFQELPVEFAESVHPIGSIQPEQTDFSDLAPLKKAIGNRRVVMLGEQDHGDGSAFKAKVRLIKFLHQEMGFAVLAFENGFFESNQVGKRFYQGEADVEEIRMALYGIWKNARSLAPLFEYMERQRKTEKPLRFSGFDCRHKGAYTQASYLPDLKQTLEPLRKTPDFPDGYDDFLVILAELLDKEYSHAPEEAARDLFMKVLEGIQRCLGKASVPDQEFWIQELNNIRGFAKNSWYQGDNREKQMGENLLWLIEKGFPEQKIIVWAHNFHIAKNLEVLKKANLETSSYSLTMGSVIYRQHAEQVYCLGLVSYQGDFCCDAWKGDLVKTRTIQLPGENDLENALFQQGHPYAFVDLLSQPAEAWIRQPHGMMGVDHYERVVLDWGKIYDGLFYIQTMEPSRSRTSTAPPSPGDR